MNNTLITDIYGNKLVRNNDTNGRLPFIIIHTTQPYLLLRQVMTVATSTVWRIKQAYLEHVLYFHSIRPSKFATIGDIWLPSLNLPPSLGILLVNTEPEISQSPVNFVRIDNIGSFNLWSPVNGDDFKPMGLMASETVPPNDSIRLVNVDFVREYRIVDNLLGKLTNMNEFNLLGHVDIKRFTVNRNSMLANDMNIRLVNKATQNIITHDDILRLRRTKNKDYQKIRYSVQGELMLSNKCLGVSIDDNTRDQFVYLQKCQDLDGQKWYPFRDTFISQFDRTCLTDENGVLKALPCDDNEDQKWISEDLNTVTQPHQEQISKWTTKKGKNVVLLEPDNPWYINKVDREPEGYVKQSLEILEDPLEDEQIQKTNQPADPLITTKKGMFYSNFMMNTKKPDMGYGYSVAQRAGKPCLCMDDCNKIPENPQDEMMLEHFGVGVESKNKCSKKKKLKFYLSCFVIMIITLLVVRYLFIKYSQYPK